MWPKIVHWCRHSSSSDGSSGYIAQPTCPLTSSPAARQLPASSLGRIKRAYSCPAGQHIQDIFSADNRQHECLRVAIDGGEKPIPRFHPAGHMHAPRMPGRARAPAFPCRSPYQSWLGCSAASASTLTSRYCIRGVGALQSVQLRYHEVIFRPDQCPEHPRLCGPWHPPEFLRIQHRARADHGAATGVDPVQPQWVDFVQGTKFTVRIPPSMGQFRKFGQFGRIDVQVVIHGGVFVRQAFAITHKKAPLPGFCRSKKISWHGCRPLRFQRDGSLRDLPWSCCQPRAVFALPSV